MMLMVIFGALLSTAFATRCSEEDMVFACDNVDSCWQELEFMSTTELEFLCNMFKEISGMDLEYGNEAGRARFSVSMQLSESAATPIIITQAPRDRYIKPGDRAEFTCSAQNAAKVSVLKSGSRFSNGRAKANEVVQTWVTWIESVSHEDQGWITCFAVREGGAYSLARAYLTITDICENSNCGSSEVCNPDIFSGSYTCEIEGECPTECTTEYRPVCASDCRTYVNECFMKKIACQQGQIGVFVESEGPCTFSPQAIHFTENPEDGEYTEGFSTFSAAVAAPEAQRVQYLWYQGEQLLGQGPELTILLLASHAGEWEVRATSCHGRFEISETFNVAVEKNGSEEPAEQCCKVHGDPHIETFDGKRYDYMGSCDYVIAEDTMGQWLVYGTYKACGDKSKQLSCIVSITVFFEKEMVQFLRMYRINYKGREFSVPLGGTENIGQIRVENTAMKYLIYLGDTGVRIMWDGIAISEICLPSQCQSGVQGMCGNADCNPDNDFAGFISSSAFGNKWAIGKDCDLEPEDGALPVPRTRPCDFIPYEEKLAHEARCNLILDMNFFSDCMLNTRMDRGALFANCMFDMCSGLTIGGGCANRGDQRCDAEIEARIAEAILNGMTEARAIAKYKPTALDPACVMGYNLEIQCSAWGIMIDNSWTVQAECPNEEERRKTVICP